MNSFFKIWKERLQRFLYEEGCYSIGVRQRTSKLLFEGNSTPFKVIPINKHEWYADPLIFHYKGEDWLFCEVYDRDNNKGKIGVTKLDGEYPIKPHIVLETDCHLSYPCVFIKDGDIYMIPETTTRKNIMLFRAVSFPDKWEEVGELLKGGEFADSTIYQDGERTLLFTFEQYEGDGSITKIHIFDISSWEHNGILECTVVNNTFSNQIRGGGNFFSIDGRLMRPAQDCGPYYGYALNFMEVESCSPIYKEHLYKKVTPIDINVDTKHKIIGTHTYSLTDSYEVIDVMFNDIILSHQIKRLYNFIVRCIKERVL